MAHTLHARQLTLQLSDKALRSLRAPSLAALLAEAHLPQLQQLHLAVWQDTYAYELQEPAWLQPLLAQAAASMRLLSLHASFQRLPRLANLRHLLLTDIHMDLSGSALDSVKQLHALETLYLDGELMEDDFTGHLYTCENPPLDLQGCTALRAISIMNLTPQQILVPAGCQVKLHTDLGMAQLNWPELCQVVTHAVIYSRNCPDALPRLVLMSAVELSRMTVLHLRGETVGKPTELFYVDSKWASLQHLFIEASSISLVLGQGLRLRTLELFARNGGLSLIMNQPISSLEAFHVSGKTEDIKKVRLYMLAQPFVARGELDDAWDVPVHNLPHGRSFVFFPLGEHACSPSKMLGAFQCGACPTCLQRAGILHDAPEVKDKREQCFQTIMTDFADALLLATYWRAMAGGDLAAELCPASE